MGQKKCSKTNLEILCKYSTYSEDNERSKMFLPLIPSLFDSLNRLQCVDHSCYRFNHITKCSVFLENLSSIGHLERDIRTILLQMIIRVKSLHLTPKLFILSKGKIPEW